MTFYRSGYEGTGHPFVFALRESFSGIKRIPQCMPKVQSM